MKIQYEIKTTFSRNPHSFMRFFMVFTKMKSKAASVNVICQEPKS